VETEDIVVHDIYLFAKAIAAANNFEIYPLVNGKLRLSLMFYYMFVGIA